MSLTVETGFFKELSEVVVDIRKTGFWPTTFISPESDGLPVHWHDHDVHAYILEGETWFDDAGNGKRLPAKVGDKVVVPARTLHAEGAIKGRVVYMLATPEAMGLDTFLKMQDPGDL
jgi:quercetin dioxygenase-like cupin family protein